MNAVPDTKTFRHKVDERQWLEEDFREYIASKSDHNCVCCGKKKYFGYGATIDHYVPLSRGGTNDETNLVMMCEDCNKEKDNKIIPPYFAARFLKEDHLDKLNDYFDDYLSKYQYVSRKNLMLCDLYGVAVADSSVVKAAKKNPKLAGLTMQRMFALKRVRTEDFDKLTTYLNHYLNKYDPDHKISRTRECLEFWKEFGCMYFIESKSKDIKLLCAITVNSCPELEITLFDYYSKPVDYTLCDGVIRAICKEIISENNLPYLPFSVNMLGTDTLADMLLPGHKPADDLGFVSNAYFYDPFRLQTEGEIYRTGNLPKELERFFDNFKDISSSAAKYLEEKSLKEDLNWLLEGLERGRKNVWQAIEKASEAMRLDSNLNSNLETDEEIELN